ncbi:MAG: acyltransferase [Clostridium sp.]
MDKSKKIVYLEILRVIACFAVIMIHSSAYYLKQDCESFNFWIGNIFDSLSRIGVPLFIMISGALMLDKNYNYSDKKLIKHIKKMVVFFIFWSIMYSFIFNILLSVIIQHKSFNVVKITWKIIDGYYHLWFMYLIIGLYMLIPLLRLWVKEENKRYIEYFLILSVIFTYVFPQIMTIGSNYSKIFTSMNTTLENKLALKYVGGFTTYFILGWYLNNFEIKNKKLIYILGLIGLLTTIIGTYILTNTIGKPVQMYDNLYINILLQGVAVFVFIKEKFKNKNEVNPIISSISKYSLGIYAIHALFVTIMYRTVERFNFNYAIINIPMIFIIAFIVAYILTCILSKIPGLKKVV